MKFNETLMLSAVLLMAVAQISTGINAHAQDHKPAIDQETNQQEFKQKSEKKNLDDQEPTEAELEAHAKHDGESNFARDRDVFHFLLANHKKITRKVTELDNGVDTLTESDDPAIAQKIQEHVAAMYKRVKKHQPIRMRDPLFREVFKHADKIEMKLEKTEHGIRITETSEDEYVVKVIQAHAEVLSKFVEHGFQEAHKNHNAPQR